MLTKATEKISIGGKGSGVQLALIGSPGYPAPPPVQTLLVTGRCIEEIFGGGRSHLGIWLVRSWFWVADVLEGVFAWDGDGSVSFIVGG